jgi:hypothetical protein
MHADEEMSLTSVLTNKKHGPKERKALCQPLAFKEPENYTRLTFFIF